MDLKDFQKGKTAWLLSCERRWVGNQRVQPIPVEVTIDAVGKKYVHAGFRTKFFHNHPKDPYLLEQVSFGSPRYLFLTEAAAKDYQFREDISARLSALTYKDFVHSPATSKELGAAIKILEAAVNIQK